jgi:2-methylcitrate dehydratase PrpD
MVREIAELVSGFDLDDLSKHAAQRLNLMLLANLSVAVAGVPYCVFAEPAQGGRYHLITGRTTQNATAAAFWNAAVMHARTQDDFHPVGNIHLGTVIIPSLLAIADEKPVTGREFLSALAVGYMVAVGISRASSPLTSPRGLRSTSLYGPFGVAAAVGRLRSAGAERIASALGLSTAFASGTTQTWIDGSDEWQLHVALCAEAGLRAVDLAMAGVVGGSQALSGSAGFFNAFTGKRPTFSDMAPDFDPSAAIGECVIKRYPVSGICQSVVLAAERLAARLPPAPDIREVRVSMNEFEISYPGTSSRGPYHSFSSKLMSAAFCCASVLAAGRFSFTDFQGPSSPQLKEMLQKVTVVGDAKLPLLSASLTIELGDGTVLNETLMNSRDEIAIEWASIDAWAGSLWTESGRSLKQYEGCRDYIENLGQTAEVRFPEQMC